MKTLSLLLFSIFFNLSALAASCCGGGSAFPGIITGDYRTQVTTSIGQGETVADAIDGHYYSRPSSNLESSRTFTFDIATRLNEDMQISLSLPVLERSKSMGTISETDGGLGDPSLSLSYEFLPEFTYSPWKPRGFIFTRILLPVAPSLYDTEATLQTDARGEGFYSLSIGSLFIKTFGAWDVMAGAEYRHRFEESFGPLTVNPGNIYSLLFGGGYSFSTSPWRVGFTSQTLLTEGASQSGGTSTVSSGERVVLNSTVTFSYLFDNDIMMAGSYNDQTLLGPSKNTPLERLVTIQYQKRWSL